MGKINYSKTFPGNSGLAPHLTGASPPTHRFRLCDLEAGDFLDRLKKLPDAKQQKQHHSRIYHHAPKPPPLRDLPKPRIKADKPLKHEKQYQPGNGGKQLKQHISNKAQRRKDRQGMGQDGFNGNLPGQADPRQASPHQQGNQDAPAEINPHMEQNGISDLPCLAVNVGKQAA